MSPYQRNRFLSVPTVICFVLFLLVLVAFLTLLLSQVKPEAGQKMGSVPGRLSVIWNQLWPSTGSWIIIWAFSLLVFVLPWSAFLRFSNSKNVCSRDDFCPSALKSLQRTMHDLEKTNKVKNGQFLLTICSNRLKNLADNNWATLAKGKYSIVINGKGTVTESDLVYELVSNEILEDNPKSYINAITTYYYTPWWLTYPGLQYLESQKNSRVTRIFTFPFKIEDFFDVNSNENLSRTSRAVPHLIDPPEECLPHILVVLALHWCLNVDVYILSPMMAVPNSLEHYLVIKCLNKDVAVFGESKLNFLKMKNEDNSLCAIWATTKSNEITQTLDPASGNLVFPQEDNKIEIELEGLSENIDDLFYKLKPISLSLKTFADNSSFCELTKMILMDISGTSDIVPDYQKLQRRIIGINWSNKAHLANFMPRISNWLDKAKTCSILKNIS